MLQPGEDGALARDALAESAVDPLGTRQLQRRSPLHHAVGTLRHPYRAHAAFGHETLELPWADPITGRLVAHAGHGRSGHGHDWAQRLAGAVEARRPCLDQQLCQQRLQIRRFSRQRSQPRRARLALELKRLREQSVQTVPVFDSESRAG